MSDLMLYTKSIRDGVHRIEVGALSQGDADWAERALDNHDVLLDALRDILSECVAWNTEFARELAGLARAAIAKAEEKA